VERIEKGPMSLLMVRSRVFWRGRVSMMSSIECHPGFIRRTGWVRAGWLKGFMVSPACCPNMVMYDLLGVYSNFTLKSPLVGL